MEEAPSAAGVTGRGGVGMGMSLLRRSRKDASSSAAMAMEDSDRGVARRPQALTRNQARQLSHQQDDDNQEVQYSP